VTTYNVEFFVGRAIQSVLDQSYRELEVIVVDDRSTDHTRDVLAHFAAQDQRVSAFTVSYGTMGGVGAAANIGLSVCRGRFVLFFDGDDWLEPHAVATLVNRAVAWDLDIVVADFVREYSDGTRLPSYDYGIPGRLEGRRVMDASTEPLLFRLSPVPWRKLFRVDMLRADDAQFSELDYFFEDTAFHWFTLFAAKRVACLNTTLVHHRMNRGGGQTSDATQDPTVLVGILASVDSIGNRILSLPQSGRRITFEKQFVDWVDHRTHWIAERQNNPTKAVKFRNRLFQLATKWRLLLRAKDQRPKTPYMPIDLTVVIPCFNNGDNLQRLVDNILLNLRCRFEVILVDDGSSDDSLAVALSLQRLYPTLVYVYTSDQHGAGRARNLVIPLIEGRYTYFLDGDDGVNATALTRALNVAVHQNLDLLFLPYEIGFVADDGRVTKVRGPWDGDARVFRATDHIKRAAFTLVNYPWNRLVRTDLMRDQGVNFGPTKVHNDILFHWTSIAAATRVSLFNETVCRHFKFNTGKQLTNVATEARLQVLDAVDITFRHLQRWDFCAVAEFGTAWNKFVQTLLSWAKSRVPPELQPTYKRRSQATLKVRLCKASTTVTRSNSRGAGSAGARRFG